MASVGVRCANLSPSKRTFDQALLDNYAEHSAIRRHALTSSNRPVTSYSPSSHSPPKRRTLSLSRATTMLADNTQIMSGSFPSLMSVFGSEETNVTSIYRELGLDEPKQQIEQHDFGRSFANNSISVDHHQQQPAQPPPTLTHRTSVHSLMSDSTESSPTTTSSTFDSPIISDSSPSSSPESASSIAPLSSFQAVLNTTTMNDPMDMSKTTIFQSHELQPVQETKKNVKKLTLDMTLPAMRPSALPDGSQPFSAPTSPFREPLKSARRKPTNLTIRTPGFQQLSFAKALNDVPPTPSTRPALHAYQSSPSLSSFTSPRHGPAGGMRLPMPLGSLSQDQSASVSSQEKTRAAPIVLTNLPNLREEEEDYQVPKSQEAPERGYTEGPVRIYDTGVYLYLEPTAEEASQFDIVFNVAKEIKNPFVKRKADEGTIMSVWRKDAERPQSTVPEPQTAVSEISFKTAIEWPESQSTATPTTPTQSDYKQKPREPEYVHVRWDHNSEILEDLWPLCNMIDDRVKAGKKVLVHCQLGVSRSASLIIAYGLFKGHQPDFHSMYEAVKKRSRWVGPNMSLIYQLTDFRSRLNNGGYANCSKEPKPEWFQHALDDANTPVAATVSEPTSAVAVVNKASISLDSQIQPNIVPLLKKITPLRLNKALPPVPPFPGSENSATDTNSIAGRLQTAPIDRTIVIPAPTTVKRAASRPLPLRERYQDLNIPAHRPRDPAAISIPRPSSIMDLAANDVPQTPSLFSPRATEFMANPFGIRGAGDLSTPGSRKSGCAPATFEWIPLRKEGHIRTASKDPRSPHQTSEPKGIYRTIDGVL